MQRRKVGRPRGRRLTVAVTTTAAVLALSLSAAPAAVAPTQIATAVSHASIGLGQSFTDTARLTAAGGGPAPTGTVDFFVYGPNNATCAGAPVASSLSRPVGLGASATSAPFTPGAPGTYRVIARYSGDANHVPVSGACNDPYERVVVAPGPAIATTVSPASIRLGQSFTDTARVTVTAGGPTPTGTVDFFVYGPNNTACAGAPVASSLSRPLTTAATARSWTLTPALSGTYRVIARYSGDANYAPVSGACNDPYERVVVSAIT
jgi:hypothetical protein